MMTPVLESGRERLGLIDDEDCQSVKDVAEDIVFALVVQMDWRSRKQPGRSGHQWTDGRTTSNGGQPSHFRRKRLALFTEFRRSTKERKRPRIDNNVVLIEELANRTIVIRVQFAG